jgi:glycogen(starch) synthase
MKVLILTADYPPHPWSGIGVAVERQARALAEIGIGVTVLVADRPLPEASAVEVLPLRRDRFPVDPRGFDAVHVHSLRLAELALELRRRFGLPLVATLHGLPHRELEPGPIARHWSAVARRLLRAADRAVFVSAAERDAAVEWLPEIAARAFVVPNGVPPLPVVPADIEDRSEGPIVFAGRFARSKGMDLLAGIVPRLVRERPVVLAGGHGDAEGEEIARRLAFAFPGRCRLAGWLSRDELDALLRRAALVLVPSRYEPFGLVALEALAAGAPVLAADVGGLREVVGEGSGGRRLGSRDPGVWAGAAAELLASGARREAACGPAWARRFSPAAGAVRLARDVYAFSAFSAFSGDHPAWPGAAPS